jgi:hypothetical protein
MIVQIKLNVPLNVPFLPGEKVVFCPIPPPCPTIEAKKENQKGKTKVPVETTYSLEEPISSCFVTKQFVTDLEAYIIIALCEIEGKEESEIRKRLNITISDTSGQDVLQSIAHYTDARFPNDIKGISLRYHNLMIGNQCALTVRLSRERIGTEFTMEVKAIESKKRVNSTKLHLFDMLKKQRTWNWVFHPTLRAVGAFLIVAFTLLSVLALPAIAGAVSLGAQGAFNGAAIGVGIGMISWIYFFLLPFLQPYTTFDTNRNEAIGKRFSWLAWSLVFLIVSLPASYVFKRIADSWLEGSK